MLTQDSITLILLAVFLLSAIGLVMVGLWIYRHGPSSKKQQRVSRYVIPSSEKSAGEAAGGRRYVILSGKDINKIRDWLNKTLRGLASEKMQVKLSSAYWKITDVEYILIRALGVVLALLLGWLIFGSILAGIFLMVIAFMVPSILLDRAIARRQKMFQQQLLDMLTLIKGSVQAGYSLMQALNLAVEEVPPPASEEFGRVLYEVRLGLSLEDALFNLAERMESDDLQIVVTAIIINEQVGGNLTTVLESTVTTIRDRLQLQGEIRSLTAYAKYVGNFLSLLPFVTGIGIFFLSPGYFDTLTSSLLTQVMFLMALLGIILGNVWIRQIVKIKV
ncbi:MAG: type II secretion system F family protein [Chloroflexota bacterium]|nr:type II secretion system F family protein [Chloroflexota bacterium]